MEIREAIADDAIEMSLVLQDIARTTGTPRATDAEYVMRHYIEHPDKVACHVAISESGQLIGFQSLKRASADNPYDVPTGWGIIGTQVSPGAARTGVAARLFTASLHSAKQAKLSFIDATIGWANAPAQAYYERMGFESYRETDRSVCKKFTVPREAP